MHYLEDVMFINGEDAEDGASDDDERMPRSCNAIV